MPFLLLESYVDLEFGRPFFKYGFVGQPYLVLSSGIEAEYGFKGDQNLGHVDGLCGLPYLVIEECWVLKSRQYSILLVLECALA